jgi:hypothetical protein
MKKFTIQTITIIVNKDKINIVCLECKNEKYILYSYKSQNIDLTNNIDNNIFLKFHFIENIQILPKKKLNEASLTLNNNILLWNNNPVYYLKNSKNIQINNNYLKPLLSIGLLYNKEIELPPVRKDIISDILNKNIKKEIEFEEISLRNSSNDGFTTDSIKEISIKAESIKQEDVKKIHVQSVIVKQEDKEISLKENENNDNIKQEDLKEIPLKENKNNDNINKEDSKEIPLKKNENNDNINQEDSKEIPLKENKNNDNINQEDSKEIYVKNENIYQDINEIILKKDDENIKQEDIKEISLKTENIKQEDIKEIAIKTKIIKDDIKEISIKTENIKQEDIKEIAMKTKIIKEDIKEIPLKTDNINQEDLKDIHLKPVNSKEDSFLQPKEIDKNIKIEFKKIINEENKDKQTFNLENVLNDFNKLFQSFEDDSTKKINKLQPKEEVIITNKSIKSIKPVQQETVVQKQNKEEIIKFIYLNNIYRLNSIKLDVSNELNFLNLYQSKISENNIIYKQNLAFELNKSNSSYLINYFNQKYLINKIDNMVIVTSLFNKKSQIIKNKDNFKLGNYDYMMYNNCTLFIPMINKKIYDNNYGTAFNTYVPYY